MAITALRQPAPVGESGYEGSITDKLVRSCHTGDGPVLWLAAQLERRGRFGFEKYGRYLHANNGRDAWADLRDELTDALQYVAQLNEEGRLDEQDKDRMVSCLLTILILCQIHEESCST